MSHLALSALLTVMLASCMPPPSASSVARVLALVDTVLARPRPFVTAEVGDALGVVLTETTASNAFFRVWASANGPEPFTSVEVREPQSGSVERGRDGMILLTLDTGCVTAADLASHVGPSDGVPSAPSPEAPADTPHYVAHPTPWGVVRLGYAPGSGCLRSVVVDANDAPE